MLANAVVVVLLYTFGAERKDYGGAVSVFTFKDQVLLTTESVRAPWASIG